jgi:D-3-phosphoglycerate dehydrogenase
MGQRKKVVVAGAGSGKEKLTAYLKEEYPDVDAEFIPVTPDEDELIKKAKGAEVILSQYQKMSDRVYDALLPELKAYVSIGIGFDSANVPAATKRNIIVTHVPDYCIDEVSCHAVAFILSFYRGLYLQVPRIKEGHWDIKAIVPRKRFAGSTIGLYGFGSIGRLVAKKLQGFDVNILACDPYVDDEVAALYNTRMVEFEDLLRESDVISLHAPLLESTKGIFDEKAFKAMKRDAYIVNTARAGLIDRDALYKALMEGWIAGAALDVVWNEPYPDEFDKKIIALPNVWATGHSAFYSVEAFDELMRKVANEAGRILRGEEPRRCVNKEVLKKIN